jgi:putative ABC transport system permease protein
MAAEDFNDDCYIPLSTCRARYGEMITDRRAGAFTREQVALHQVTLTVGEVDKVRPTGDIIRLMLSHHGKPDWAVTVPLDKLEEAERTKNRFKMLLVLIASISLLVGGIGIMNIMLATVTERTREIGIRRALGAKRRDITLQFLVEAVVQTSVGGLLGALVGLGVVWGLPPLAMWAKAIALPAKIHVPSIFLSLGVAVTVGVLFGWYPARRASLLDPIEALRHE